MKLNCEIVNNFPQLMKGPNKLINKWILILFTLI